MTAAVTITSATGSLGTTPEVQTNTQVTFAFTGLPVSLPHFVIFTDANGGHSGPGPRLYSSDAGGNLTVTGFTFGEAGAAAVSVYTQTPVTTVTATQTVVAAP